MRSVNPRLKSTVTSPDLREWVPTTFANVMREIEHLCRACDRPDPIALFRGHVQHDWILDCKLVREVLKIVYGGHPPYPRPKSFHTKLTDTLLAKFRHWCRPSPEALAKEVSHGIDPLYELMKRFQQYAHEDIAQPQGTFLVDWTVDRDVALYFSTYDGKGDTCRLRNSAGALWFFDPIPTGKVLQTKKLDDILAMMREDNFRLKLQKTLPLIFHPTKQTRMLRAIAQKPVYVSQMDFCCDLADTWAGTENEYGRCVFKKIILTESILADVVKHLNQKGIWEMSVYPD